MPYSQRYRVQQKKTGRGGAYVTFTLTLPQAIATAIPEHAEFEIELVDEGILYRFMGVNEGQVDYIMEDVPGWLTGDSQADLALNGKTNGHAK